MAAEEIALCLVQTRVFSLGGNVALELAPRLCNPLSLDVLNGWDAKHNTLHQRPTESHGFSTAKPPEVDHPTDV